MRSLITNVRIGFRRAGNPIRDGERQSCPTLRQIPITKTSTAGNLIPFSSSTACASALADEEKMINRPFNLCLPSVDTEYQMRRIQSHDERSISDRVFAGLVFNVGAIELLLFY